MIKYTITTLLLLTPLSTAEEDIRDKVHQGEKEASNRIDVGNHVYGYPMGISEDDFIKEEGKPNGYLNLGNGKSALIYGRSHAFLFTEKKLTGLRISSSIFDWKLANNLRGQFKHTAQNWSLSNGITANMKMTKVEKILGKDLVDNGFQPHFVLNGYRVEINYASMEEHGERVKRVYGLHITKVK